MSGFALIYRTELFSSLALSQIVFAFSFYMYMYTYITNIHMHICIHAFFTF